MLIILTISHREVARVMYEYGDSLDLKKQCSKLRWHRKSGMKIGTIREKMIDVCHPLVALNFSVNRAKAAFARARHLTYFPRVIGAGKGCEAKAIGFPATHDFPNVVGHVPSD